MVVLSRSSDRRGERRWHSAVCSVIGGATLLIATLHPANLAIALTTITIATAMMWASYTVLWAIPGDYLKGATAPGGIAFINVVGVLGLFQSHHYWRCEDGNREYAGRYAIHGCIAGSRSTGDADEPTPSPGQRGI